MDRSGKCEAGKWTQWTGQDGDCPNDATVTESWFDEEGVDVALCDEHVEGETPKQIDPPDRTSGSRNEEIRHCG